MALYASDVKINPTLSGTIGGVGSPGYNASAAIGANYANAKKKMMSDATARGVNPGAATGPNSYFGNQQGTAQGLDTGNLEAALGGGLANTAYNDALSQREYNQNMELARETGALNKPSDLQSALGAIGQLGGTTAQLYGAFGRPGMRKPLTPQIGTTDGTLPDSLSLYPGGGATQYYQNGGRF